MLADYVKQIAKKRGLSLIEVERRAGLGGGTISRWNVADPRLDSLLNVAKVLNIPVESLIKQKIRRKEDEEK